MDYRKPSLGSESSRRRSVRRNWSRSGIFVRPAVAIGIGNRVAGDVMDIVATSAAVRNSARPKAAWGVAAFVIRTAALDRQTGKTHPPLPA